jgi:hypothetical protein
MKVNELIAILQKCDLNADVIIDDTYNISLVWDCPTIGKVNITTEPTEEALDDMERDEFFMSLSDTLDEMEEVTNNFFEVIDSMKINGVQ